MKAIDLDVSVFISVWLGTAFGLPSAMMLLDFVKSKRKRG